MKHLNTNYPIPSALSGKIEAAQSINYARLAAMNNLNSGRSSAEGGGPKGDHITEESTD